MQPFSEKISKLETKTLIIKNVHHLYTKSRLQKIYPELMSFYFITDNTVLSLIFPSDALCNKTELLFSLYITT